VFEKVGLPSPTSCWRMLRADSVGGDGSVGADPLALFCDNRHTRIVLLHTVDPHAEAEHTVRQSVCEDAMQVGPVEVELRRPEVGLGVLAQRLVEEQRAVVPAQEIDRVRTYADAAQRWQKAKFVEQPDRVRPQLQRRSDRADRRRLLEHFHLEAAPEKCDRGGQPAHPSADNRDPHRVLLCRRPIRRTRRDTRTPRGVMLGSTHSRMVCPTRRISAGSGLHVDPLCAAPAPAALLGLTHPRKHGQPTSSL